MRHRVGVPLVLLVLASSLLLTPVAYGWQNGRATHRFGSQTVQQWILTEAHRLAAADGGWLDLSVALDAVDDPDTRYRDFRFHRYQRWGGRKSGAAPARVAARYQACLDALANADAVAASTAFGLLAHYYTDACDPLHTAESRAEARRNLHKRYEQRVMLLLNRTAPNRINRASTQARAAAVPSGVVAFTVSGASAAHADYTKLVRGFQRRGFSTRTARITRRNLSRAVEGLAGIMVKAGKDKKDKTPEPSPTPSPSTTPDPSSATVTVAGTSAEAVDAAISAAEARGSGTTVYFPAGTYAHGTSLTIPDGVSLKGSGIGATKLEFTLVFGSDQTVSDMRVGAAPRTALFSRSGTTARDTTFVRVRFRGGGPVPGVTYDPASTSYVGYNPLIQLGGKESTRSQSHISFVDCEFERVSGPWVSRYVRGNTISAWEDNRSGRAHLEYISFVRCHFGVKNPAGAYGALSANVELKTNTYTQYPEFAHNWHDWTFTDCIFERSGDFNIDFTDSARAWFRTNGITESGTTDGVPNWTLAPIRFHAGLETGRSVTINGGVIKGSGYTSAPEWTYVICLENPLGATITGVTAYGGNRTQGEMISSSSACGPWRSGPLPTWRTPVTDYDLGGMQAAWDNRYTPGVWGAYTPSPYDP
jgi:hypothetical protein